MERTYIPNLLPGCLIVSILVLFFYEPILTIVLVVLFFHKYIELNPWFMRLLGILICVLLSTYNLLKLPESDSVAYINYIGYLSDVDLTSLFDTSYKSIKAIEMLFNSYSWVVAQVDSSGFLFNFISVFITYFLLFLSSVNISKGLEFKGSYVALIMLTLFFGLTFSLSGHLIRNYLAISLLVYIVSHSFSNDFKMSWRYSLLLFFPGFIHASLLIFPFLLMFFYYLQSKLNKVIVVFSLSLFTGLLLSLFIDYLLSMIGGKISDFDQKIPIFMILFDTILSFLFIVLIAGNQYLGQKVKLFGSLLCGFIFILAISSSTNLIFYRYYFIFDFLRGILAFILISKYINLNSIPGFVINMMIVTFSIMFFCFRISSSGWDYGDDFFTIFFNYSLLDLSERIVAVWFK